MTFDYYWKIFEHSIAAKFLIKKYKRREDIFSLIKNIKKIKILNAHFHLLKLLKK